MELRLSTGISAVLSDTFLNPWDTIHRFNDMWCAHESILRKIFSIYC